MSSLGPLVYAVHHRNDVASRGVIEGAALSAAGSVVAYTAFRDSGYELR